MNRIILISILFIPILASAQLDTLRKISLASIDSLEIEVMRINMCEKVGNHYSGEYYSANYKYNSNYFVFHNGDSIQFHLWTGTGCPSPNDPPSDYKEFVNLECRNLDKQGKPELILEFEYSTGGPADYHRKLIIINLDSMDIIFSKEIEARGQHFYGEMTGEHYWFKYEVSFTETGDIFVTNGFDASGKSLGEVYKLVGEKYEIHIDKNRLLTTPKTN